jgi:hypothetical protein
MISVTCAKTAAVFSVIYAGVNAHQLLANFADVREKAKQFSEIAAGEGGTARLRIVRARFYLAAPLAYLWTMVCAGLPGPFLIAAGAKFWMSSFIGIRTEHRQLRGEDYGARDHGAARFDAMLNIALAIGAVWLILARWA